MIMVVVCVGLCVCVIDDEEFNNYRYKYISESMIYINITAIQFFNIIIYSSNMYM